MLALRVGTLPHRAALQPLLHHVRTAAVRAFLSHGLTPCDEFTIGIPVAAVEGLALLRSPLNDLAFAAFGALYPDGLLLDILAGGVIAARGEFAKPAGLQHQMV